MRTLLGYSVAAALLLAGCADSSAQPAGPVRAVGAAAVTVPPEPETGPVSGRGEVRAALPEVSIREAALPVPESAAPPTRLVFEAMGADMPVDPVGIGPDGQMEIPDDAMRAGWYRYSAAPSDQDGSVVIAAHNGSVVTPRGALRGLGTARVGDAVLLLDAEGGQVTYRVDSVEVLQKAIIDFGSYFTRDGGRRLVLITCGGEWDRTRQSYDSNIIVTASISAP